MSKVTFTLTNMIRLLRMHTLGGTGLGSPSVSLYTYFATPGLHRIVVDYGDSSDGLVVYGSVLSEFYA